MKNTLSKLVIFTAGVAIGSIVTYKYVEKKYQTIMREEITKIKEYYSGVKSPEVSVREMIEEGLEKANTKAEQVETYKQIISDAGYTNYNSVKKEEKKEEDDVEKPYVIEPYEFDEMEDYEKIELHYYTDGILADDDDNIVEDVDEIVGKDSLLHFGEYEDDAVYVRNDALQSDYAILMDYQGYHEMMQNKYGSRPMEGR